MALIVHKYGGTSMGSPERISNVAKRVAKWHRAGHQMVVVPSAMSGETTRLLGLAKELAPNLISDAYHRELDMLASTGEQASSALLAIALQAQGIDAISYAGWQVPIKTNSAFTKARIESIDDVRVRKDLAAGRVVIVTGFQCSVLRDAERVPPMIVPVAAMATIMSTLEAPARANIMTDMVVPELPERVTLRFRVWL
jgi:aspartate kinase